MSRQRSVSGLVEVTALLMTVNRLRRLSAAQEHHDVLILSCMSVFITLKSSSLIGFAEPRRALRTPGTFRQLVSTTTSATEARGDPQSDHEDAPQSEKNSETIRTKGQRVTRR